MFVETYVYPFYTQWPKQALMILENILPTEALSRIKKLEKKR